jgi:hypothetical protein
MISLISFGSLMRATPPWTLISAGTRSSAMTAAAPASSAMRACVVTVSGRKGRVGEESTCSAFTTSMITPPCNIRANPAFTAKSLERSMDPLTGSSVAIFVCLVV